METSEGVIKSMDSHCCSHATNRILMSIKPVKTNKRTHAEVRLPGFASSPSVALGIYTT